MHDTYYKPPVLFQVYKLNYLFQSEPRDLIPLEVNRSLMTSFNSQSTHWRSQQMINFLCLLSQNISYYLMSCFSKLALAKSLHTFKLAGEGVISEKYIMHCKNASIFSFQKNLRAHLTCSISNLFNRLLRFFFSPGAAKRQQLKNHTMSTSLFQSMPGDWFWVVP